MATWITFRTDPSGEASRRWHRDPVNSAESGARLARFVTHLQDTAGVTEVDFVGYSLGGIVARSAMKQLQRAGSSVRVRSLISIGTPWLGSFVGKHDASTLPLPPIVAEYVSSFILNVRSTVAAEPGSIPANQPAWATGYDHVLDGLPLTRIAGVFFPAGDIVDGAGVQLGVLEANDGHCTESSALAIDADPVALPPAACFTLPDLHSNYLADLLEIPWERSINWSPATYDIVIEAIRRAGHQ